MSITAKTTVAMLAILAAMLVGACLVLDTTVRPAFLRQEAAVNEADQAALREDLRTIGRDLRARALDYARWDDTYAFVAGGMPSYIESNFGGDDEWLANYGADLAIIANEQGRVLWSRERGGRTEAANAALEHTIIEQAFLAAPRRSAPIEGVIWTESGPLLFGAARATRSDGSGQTRGLVVIGRELDVAAMASDAQLTVRFISAADMTPEQRARLAARGADPVANWRDDNTLFTLLPLASASGDLAGVVLAQRPRDIAALGRDSAASAVLTLAVMFVLAIGALWFLLRRVVIERIVQLERHFHAQEDEMSPAPDDESKDEIGQLTRAYNALSQRLRAAVEAERDAVAAREVAAGANRMKSQFLANISHELRTPLNDVIGFAELIDEDLADAGVTTARADLQRITDAARHLLTLTNEILDLSRIEAEKLDVRPEEFRIDEMVRSAVETATVLARANSSAVRVDYQGDLGNAYSDQARWRQCLLNVLAYACKRTHAGVIRLKAERFTGPKGEMIRFQVIDQGVPLNQAQAAALFEPYSRGEHTAAPGARLGIALTRKLLKLLDGSIDVVSHFRKGCTFVLTLNTTLDMDDKAACDAEAEAEAA